VREFGTPANPIILISSDSSSGEDSHFDAIINDTKPVDPSSQSSYTSKDDESSESFEIKTKRQSARTRKPPSKTQKKMKKTITKNKQSKHNTKMPVSTLVE
jgi:hypothetical protein